MCKLRYKRITSFLARPVSFVLALTVLFAIQLSSGRLSAQANALPARITQPIDETKLVGIPHSVPAFAQARYDRGTVPDATPAEHILLVLKRSEAQVTALANMTVSQHNPSSPQYRKWLTVQQFSEQYGPAPSDLQKITQWLQEKGFVVNKTSRGGVAVDFSGTAGQVRNAFHTELHTYEQNGLVYHANNADPQIPAALATVVSGFASLNDFNPHSDLRVLGTAQFNPKSHAAKPLWNASNQCYDSQGNQTGCIYYIPTPADLAVQYNLTSVYSGGTKGAGETIGIVGDSNIDLGVVQNYRTLFGLSTTNLPNVIVDGNDPAQTGDAGEGYLDVEAAGAMAPDATIDYYVSAGSLTTSGISNAILRAVDDDAADVLSVSYGECEQNLGPAGNQFFSELWEQAAAQGESVFVSSGDGGSAGCDPFEYASAAQDGLAINGFASTPYNTAVGGTDFYYPGYAGGTQSSTLLTELANAWGGYTTTIDPSTTLVAPLQEQPWNTSLGLDIVPGNGYGIAAGSGGASSCTQGTDPDPVTGAYATCTSGYPKPAWQAGPGVPADGVRDVPDVALFAANGSNLSFWPVCASVYDCLAANTTPGYSITLTGVGGTSAASPAVAGIMALLDQSQKGRQGNVNYKLYALGSQYPNSFNDVTVGSNNVPCNQGSPNCSLDTNGDGYYTLQGYAAGAGYDQASGLGSLNAANLFANWNKVAVGATASQTALTLSQSSFTHGTAVTVSAAVTGTGGTPTGSVAVNTSIPGQTGMGTVELAQGKGSVSTQALPGGTYNLQGIYGGDTTFAVSTSSSVSVTVTPEPSTLTLSGAYVQTYSPAPLTNGASIAYGATYYLDAAVTGKSGYGLATGEVVFMDGTTVLGSANISQGGIAELVTGTPLPGSHTITATYAGDSSFNASTSSSSLAFTVSKGVPSVNYNGPNGGPFAVPVQLGQPSVFTVTVGGGNYSALPTGSVTIALGSQPAQVATLVPTYPGAPGGIAVFTIVPATAGTLPLTVNYSGDSNFAAATLPYAATITVSSSTLPATTTTLTSNTITIGPDGTVTLNFKVAGSNPTFAPTGKVAVVLGGSPYAPLVPLDASGSGSIQIGGSSFPTGPSVVNAVYYGDANYAGSTSNGITLNSNQGDFSLTTSSPDLTIASGSSANSTLILASVTSDYVLAGLSGTVALTCTTSNPSVTCALASNSATLAANGAPQTVQATINTHTAATTTGQAVMPNGQLWLQRVAGGLAVAFVFFWRPRQRARTSRLILFLLLVCALTGTLTLAGCGGHSAVPPTPTPPPNPGINAAKGTYQVTVLANASGVQHSLLIHVSVQ